MGDNYPQPPTKPFQHLPGNSNPPGSGGKSCLPGCLIGCGVVFFAFLVMISIGGYFIYTKGPGLAADFANKAINNALGEFDEISDEEKTVIREQVDRVTVAFKNGDISIDELGNTFEEISKSPAIGAVGLLALEARYINKSGLSDEERESAGRTVQRTWRGITEEKISFDDLESEFEIIGDKSEDFGRGQNWKFKEKLTDEEIRKFLAGLKTLSDNAEIPDEEFEFSIGEEIKRAVDELLGSN